MFSLPSFSLNKKFTTLLFFCVSLGVSTSAYGQAARYTEGKADQTLKGSGRINAATNAMEFSLPLGSYPGRGINVPVSLSYSSKLWHVDYASSEVTPVLGLCFSMNYASFADRSASGWTTSVGVPYIEYMDKPYDVLGNVYRDDVDIACNPRGGGTQFNPRYVKRIILHMPSGETHELRATDTIQGTASFEGTFYAIDGSNIIYVQDTGNSIFRAKMPDGSYYDFDGTTHRATRFTDRNGNYNEFHSGTYANGYWTDTLGRNIPLPVGQSAPTSAGTQTYEIPGLDGQAPIAYTLHWKQLKGSTQGDSALTDFNDSLRYYSNYYFSGNTWQTRSAGTYLFEGEFSSRITPTAGLFNPIVLTEIELPTGGSYKFSYNVWGEIDKVVYPTGGEETFTYNTVPANAYLEGPYDKANRGVVDRKVYEWSADPTPYEWTYTFPANGSRQITNPDGTKVETWYHQSLEGTGYGFDTVLAGMPYRQLAFTSDNHVVSQKLTHWTKTGIGSDGAEWHPRVDYEETIVYDSSGNGISATTLHEYNGDLGYKETPVLENKTTSYAFVSAANGSSLMPGNASAMPSIPSATPTTTIRVSELTYLIDDPNYAGIKSYYTNQNINGLVTVAKVKDTAGNVKAKTEIFYDEVGTYPIVSAGTNSRWTDPGTNYRGNVTTTKSYYDIANNLFVQTHAQYDNFGNQRKSWDGRGHLSQTDYSQTYAYAYPTGTVTQIPDPLGQKGSMISFTTATTYDYDTGLPLTTTDVNGQTTTLEYNDPLLRPTKVTAPNGQEAITEYGAGVSEATRYIRSRVQIDSTPHWKESYTRYDELGRTAISQSVDTVAGDEYVLTCYDNVGRVEKMSNPFRNLSDQDCSTENGTYDVYWTTNAFDDAGRLWKVTTPDGAVVETNYGIADAGPQIGTTVTVTDQAGKLRRSITNAVGHLTRVDEPNANNQLGDIDDPNQPTNYNYDTLNNLLTVTQGAQTRTFEYDALSRLKSATNPESGTITYAYDSNGNLTSKTDARSITTSYTYDGLNRVTRRDYSDSTPDVDYYYDKVTNAKGKLTKVSSSVSTTEYTAFDILGRVTGHRQTTGGTAYNTAYAYDLAGALVEETYPSGRKVKNTLDANGGLSLVETKPSGGAYQTRGANFTYNAAGAVTSMQLGNGNWESTQFNPRLQPTQIALGTTQNAADLLKLEYGYGTTANNGNVLSQKITVPGLAHPFEQAYAYDSLNRIASATETYNSTQTWTQVYGYDRYGNRNIASGTGATSLTFNSSNNRITTSGYTFDASGNTTADPSGRSFVYDAENKQTSVSNGGTLGTYFYDGDGKRVKKTASGDNTIFVYDAEGRLVEEYLSSSPTTVQTAYVYAGSRLLSTEDANGTNYLTADHLGSPRINTDANGAVTARHDYMPFGEEIFSTLTAQRTTSVGDSGDTIRKQFTGYERDTETGLDFAQARMYANRLGRFTVPDPLLGSARTGIPQTWNRYTYTIGNPLAFTDPFGLWVWGSGFGGGKNDADLTEDERQKRKEFIAALEIAKQTAAAYQGSDNILDRLKGGELQRATDAYGTENVDNGVTLTIGQTAANDSASTVFGNEFGLRMDRTGTKMVPDVVVTFKKGLRFDAQVVAHEGSHIADWVSLANLALKDPSNVELRDMVNSTANKSKYLTERRAYLVSSYVAEKLGVDGNADGVDYWNKGWAESDVRTKRSNGVDTILKRSYHVSPNSPGRRLIEPTK